MRVGVTVGPIVIAGGVLVAIALDLGSSTGCASLRPASRIGYWVSFPERCLDDDIPRLVDVNVSGRWLIV